MGYGIFKITKNVIDINTETKYEIRFMSNKYVLLEDNIKLKGITPFTYVLSYMHGKYPINHILNVDKHVSKEYNNKLDEYTFNDTYTPQNTIIIMKKNNIKQISSFIEKIYNLGLLIQSYEIKKLDEKFNNILDSNKNILDEEVLIMIISGLNSIEKINKLIEDKTFGDEIIYTSKSFKNIEEEINMFYYKQKQKRI